MNAASLARFCLANFASSRALRGSQVTIGETTYDCLPIFHGSSTVENDRGGETTIRTMTLHLDKELAAVAPIVGTRVTDIETGCTGEIYEIGGEGLPYHILRGASHPSKSA